MPNRKLAIATRALGREGQTLTVIDDFVPDPDALRAAAAAAQFVPGRHHYPGIRAALGEQFGRAVRVEPIDASFSIVTTPPASLTVPQRLPHVDAHGADRVALIHYLSRNGGGTAFFRHRATGFESIDEARAPIYLGQLEAELRHGGPPPPAYVGGRDLLFERHTLAEARYNRAYLYPGFLLHSGAIASGAALSPDPAKGRLTVTAFLSVT